MAKAKKNKATNGLTKFNKVLTIIFCVLLVATILIITFSNVKPATQETAEVVLDDVSVLDTEFAAGTYGGVQFDTEEDLINYYIEAFNYTKSLTAEYKNEDGSIATFYKLLGEDNLQVGDLLIDGKENGTISNLVPGIVGGLFSNGLNGLPPCTNRDPNLDLDINNESLQTSRLTADDILACYATDNGDGTITLTMQPKMYELSTPGLDCQGHMFTTLGDITSTVASISVLSWAEGDTSSNVKCNYIGGSAVVTIDTATKEITKAEYHEVVKIAVTHANVTIIKDKSASLTVRYDMTYPASDQYLMDTKGISRV